MCRAGAARADLHKYQMCRTGQKRAAGRAAPGRAADLRFRAARSLSADEGRCGPHGGKARRGAAEVRHLREAPRHHPHLRHARDQQAPQDAYQAAAAPHVHLHDVREETRHPAHLPSEVGLQGPQAPGGDEGAPAQAEGRPGTPGRETQGDPRTAGSQAQAGRGRAAGPGESPQAGGEEAVVTAAAAGRPARAGDLQRPGLPEIRVPGVLEGHGRLPGASRRGWRLTCSS